MGGSIIGTNTDRWGDPDLEPDLDDEEEKVGEGWGGRLDTDSLFAASRDPTCGETNTPLLPFSP